MYELFILGELLSGPKHGYLLHSILKSVLGPFRSISWGVLYPLIKRLLGEGLIIELEEEPHTGGKGRLKRIYALTERGKQRFFELLEKPLHPYNLETKFTFRLKLLYLNWVPVERRILCLQDYLKYCHFTERYIKNCEDEVKQNPHIGHDEKQQTLLTFCYRMNGILSEQMWLSNEINKLQGSLRKGDGHGERTY